MRWSRLEKAWKSKPRINHHSPRPTLFLARRRQRPERPPLGGLQHRAVSRQRHRVGSSERRNQRELRSSRSEQRRVVRQPSRAESRDHRNHRALRHQIKRHARGQHHRRAGQASISKLRTVRSSPAAKRTFRQRTPTALSPRACRFSVSRSRPSRSKRERAALRC